MYTFSSRLKTFSFILMIVGVLGIGYSFFTAPKDINDVEAILANQHGHHGEEAHAESPEHQEAKDANVHTAGHSQAAHAEVPNAAHGHSANAHAADAHGDEHHAHLEHVLHQLQNKPWAGVYVAAIFFMLIALGALAFYAIQNAASAGWSPVLFRVMEGISAYLIPGAIIVFVLLVLGVMHIHHLFVWMDP